MTAPKTKFPISSFGPELMQALLRGGRERFVIPFPGEAGKRKAHKFQQRIHMLRQRMRQERHEQYELAARVRVSLFWGSKAVAEGAPKDWEGDEAGAKGAWIVIRPQDSEFSEVSTALAAASPIPALPQPRHEEAEPDDHPHSPAPTLDDLFNELGDDSEQT